jgi:hypothetical protein
MRHFDWQNRHKIKDASLGLWATVSAGDAETFSELSRNGFHLIDMTGEIWTLRRGA